MDRILSCEINITHLRRLSVFSVQNSMKLEFINRRKTGKFTKMWKLNNRLLNKQCVKEQIKIEIKKILRIMKMKIQHTKTYEMPQKQF